MYRERDQKVLHYVQNSVLQPREKLVWKGRPNPLAAASVGLGLFFFGIFFFGFAIFWTAGASAAAWAVRAADGQVFPLFAGVFPLFGVPFLAVGAWMVSGPVRNYLRAARSYYAITDKRILIITAGRGYTVRTIFADKINDYERTDNGDGSGSIRLKKTIINSGRGTRSSVVFADGLWGIADVKGAADAITALQTVE